MMQPPLNEGVIGIYGKLSNLWRDYILSLTRQVTLNKIRKGVVFRDSVIYVSISIDTVEVIQLPFVCSGVINGIQYDAISELTLNVGANLGILIGDNV